MFVHEKISPQDQMQVGFPNLRDQWGKLIRPYVWIVDRSRNAYLIEGNPFSIDEPRAKSFIFGWDNVQIRVALSCRNKRIAEHSVDWHWEKSSDFLVGNPFALKPTIVTADAVTALKEALTVDSSLFQAPHSVTFDF
jgi:hypothetical protein